LDQWHGCEQFEPVHWLGAEGDEIRHGGKHVQVPERTIDHTANPAKFQANDLIFVFQRSLLPSKGDRI
jgi:hypothetical protein